MRIIAGTYRGRKLLPMKGLAVRPMTGRVRQTVFDILSNRIEWEGITVLDLFAGSGSLGIEALSRGAAQVTCVDNSRESLDILYKNIRALGCEDRVHVHQADVLWYLKHAKIGFDVIFADPPYRFDKIDRLPVFIAQSAAARPGTYVVMEHGRETDVDVPEEGYETTRKQFGQTTVLIMKVLAESAAKQHTEN